MSGLFLKHHELIALHAYQLFTVPGFTINLRLSDDEASQGVLLLDMESETGVCYFNFRSYSIREYGYGGGASLKYIEYGVWARKSEN